MGQQQSSEKPERTASRGGTPSDQQKRVNRRQSIQVIPVSRGRSSPANPSATNASAVAETTKTAHLETPQLEQYLHASPDALGSKGGRLARSGSRREKKDETAPDVKPQPQPQLPAVPMAVPVAKSKPDDFDQKAFEKAFDKDDYEDRRYIPPSQLRPPRLPLPIADAILPIPESPSLDPIDKGTADVPSLGQDASLGSVEPALRRRSSMVSQTTQDGDDDVGDELPPVDPNQQTVPTTIEWNNSGHRVYVTGTFANWEKKFRLHHKKDAHGLSATINLPPGTHHLLFLVDEKMTTNPSLPTAVDFSNVLVNYIEIATEDFAPGRRHSTAAPEREKRDSTQIDRPEAVPEEAEPRPDSSEESLSDEVEPLAEEIHVGDFRQLIPQALHDMDLPEDDQRYHQATQVIGDTNGPPSLPMFLSRSILNGITPVKDDSSVLVLPNHTVLNHLMTSSVKNGVLATSVTTRYKKKYVTTISFKPVPPPKQVPGQS